jgi:hypothetical protein
MMPRRDARQINAITRTATRQGGGTPPFVLAAQRGARRAQDLTVCAPPGMGARRGSAMRPGLFVALGLRQRSHREAIAR